MVADTVTEDPSEIPNGSPTEIVTDDDAEAVTATHADATGTARERSTIQFPYEALDAAIVVARTVHDVYGGSATSDQIAGALSQNATSGAFRNKVSASRIFGLVTVDRQGVRLTELGGRLMDQRTEGRAKAEAFLAVPLYSGLYQQYRSTTLPGDAGLEVAIRSLGVSPKQVQRARQAFQRSAETAGFFAQGRDRLVMPAVDNDQPETETQEAGENSSDRDDARQTKGVASHPLMVGMLQALPEPGKPFPAKERERWLRALGVNFEFIYGPTEHEGSEGAREAPPHP